MGWPAGSPVNQCNLTIIGNESDTRTENVCIWPVPSQKRGFPVTNRLDRISPRCEMCAVEWSVNCVRSSERWCWCCCCCSPLVCTAYSWANVMLDLHGDCVSVVKCHRKKANSGQLSIHKRFESIKRLAFQSFCLIPFACHCPIWATQYR